MNAHALVSALAQRRPVFHSEADFQHAFAWELHLRFPQASIRLERPIQTSLGPLHVDLVAAIEADVLAFELKYKTRALVTVSGDEIFHLQDHGAQPPTRYDFLKDVARLESLGEDMPRVISWAILLTNDSAYWCEPRALDGTSAAFSLCDGRTCSGHLDWGANTSAGTKRKRENPIKLNGEYSFQWREYSSVEAKYYSRFRYLAVEVVRPVMAS
jgi:hypothetical protein